MQADTLDRMALRIYRSMKRVVLMLGATALALSGLIGCHSHYVAATIKNDSGAPITVIELDYPSASFGTDMLAAGAVYHYRFKILGEGPTKLLWTDAKHQDHTVAGPSLHEGQEGALTATITGNTAIWEQSLRAN